MNGSDIKIDKEGVWYYRGAHMFRKDILCIFFENLNLDNDGRYFVKLNQEICYLDVEDTAFVILSVYQTKDPSCGLERLEVILSDESKEVLDVQTLTVGPDNIMYCRIKEGKFTARFTRKSYYQLAEFIEQDGADDSFYIFLNDHKYFIASIS
jgi:uncharacterized protein